MNHEDKNAIPRRQSKPRIKITEVEQASINNVVQAANIQFQEQLEQERLKQKYTDLQTLDAMLSEHIGPYMLIGFNLNNEPIEIFNAKNPLEAGALSDHFKKVFVERSVRHGNDFF